MAMTNADVIRKMSDMQLHRFLEDFRADWFDTAATFCDLCEPCKMHEVLRTESSGGKRAGQAGVQIFVGYVR